MSGFWAACQEKAEAPLEKALYTEAPLWVRVYTYAPSYVVGGAERSWGDRGVRQQTYPETLVILAGWGDGVGLGDGKAADVPGDTRHTGRLGGRSGAGGW